MSDDALPQFLLIDAQRLHRQFPDTFAVPSFDDIASLKSGDLVKIGVEFERDSGGHGGERFWVVVVAAFDKTSPACLRGRIDNDLVCTARHGLGLNDEIDFDPQHILAIQDRGLSGIRLRARGRFGHWLTNLSPRRRTGELGLASNHPRGGRFHSCCAVEHQQIAASWPHRHSASVPGCGRRGAAWSSAPLWRSWCR